MLKIIFSGLLLLLMAKATTGQVIVTSTVNVNGKTANDIFAFIQHCDKDTYLRWHTEHKDFRVIRKTDNFVGSKLYFKEIIKGFKVNYTWKVQHVEVGKYIELKANYLYPVYLILTFKDEMDGTFVQQDLIMGKKNQLFNVDWLIKRLIITPTVAQNLRNHFVEEFKNLEHLAMTSH